MIGWQNPDYLSKLMLAFVKESECEVQCRHIYTIWTGLAILRLLYESKHLGTEAKAQYWWPTPVFPSLKKQK